MEQDNYNGTVVKKKKKTYIIPQNYVYKRSINHKQPKPLTFLLAAACVSRKTRREIITKHPKNFPCPSSTKS